MRYVEALVHAGGSETAYVRAGRGPAVVLLEDAPDPGGPLFRALAVGARVTAPVPSPMVLSADEAGGAALAAWLWDVLDGLGLERSVLVVGRRLAARMGPCLAEHGGRLERVVVVEPPGGADAAEWAAAAVHGRAGGAPASDD